MNSSLLETIKIPVPDLGKQKSIAKEVAIRRNKAFQLRKEAVQRLDDAKAQVERMIHGGNKFSRFHRENDDEN